VPIQKSAGKMVSKISKDFGLRGSGPIAAARMVFLIVLGVVFVASALPFLA
jgi:hypothetical protein